MKDGYIAENTVPITQGTKAFLEKVEKGNVYSYENFKTGKTTYRGGEKTIKKAIADGLIVRKKKDWRSFTTYYELTDVARKALEGSKSQNSAGEPS